MDITPPIAPDLRVWPGDTPPAREVLLDMQRGDNLTLSTLHSTVHVGAHADGPNHYGLDAPAIDECSLDDYIGPAQVVHVDVRHCERVTCEMFEAARKRLETSLHQPGGGVLGPAAPVARVLIATGSYPDPTVFNEDFAALSPELVDHLHERGVRLVGIDTPSVDLFNSRDLPAHKRFLAHEMAILEGLVLRAVPEGLYELIALPLKLVGFDASPVRAILRPLDW